MGQQRAVRVGRRMAILGGAAVASLSVAGTASSSPNCSGRVDPAKVAKCAHKSAAPTHAPLRSFVAGNPETQPPLHGTLPHGQGTVAVLQLAPDTTRPYGNNPTGLGDNNGAPNPAETLVVGRARGEQRANGTYHGHITVAALAGNEIVGIDTNPGESKVGPLSAVQQQALNPLCTGTMNSVCLSAVVANSTTTNSGSTNHFETAHATLGATPGSNIDVGAASSDGNIGEANGCQTSTGSSRVANAKVATATADLLTSSTVSNAGTCGGAPQQQNTSQVVNLGGTGIPVPAAGCANGTPNTVTNIPPAPLPSLIDVVCNADDSQPGSTNPAQAAGPYGVREALDTFVLATAGMPPLIPASQAAKFTSAASESLAVAPAATTPTPTPTPTTPTPTPTPTGTPCNVGGDNDCATSNPNGPSLPEGGATDKARDCSEGVENTNGCPGNKGPAKTRCNSGGDNDCANGAGPFGPMIPEGGPVDRVRDCSEGITNEGQSSCAAAPAATVARTRSTLPFTG